MKAKFPSDEERATAITREALMGIPRPGQTFEERLKGEILALLVQVRAEASQEALACQDCKDYRAVVEKQRGLGQKTTGWLEVEAEVERLRESLAGCNGALAMANEETLKGRRRADALREENARLLKQLDVYIAAHGEEATKRQAAEQANAVLRERLIQAARDHGPLYLHEIEALLTRAKEQGR